MLFYRFLSPNTNIFMESMKEKNYRRIVNVILLYDIYVNQKFLFVSFAGDVHDQIFEPKSINLSNKNIFDDGISLLAFGLCNNTTLLEELNTYFRQFDK